jgi:hypothetical protein
MTTRMPLWLQGKLKAERQVEGERGLPDETKEIVCDQDDEGSSKE